MLQKKIKQGVLAIEASRRVEYAEVGTDLFAYRLTTKTVRTVHRGKRKPKVTEQDRVTEGIASKAAIDDFLAGEADFIDNRCGVRAGRVVYLVDDAYIDVLRRYGWMAPDRQIYDALKSFDMPLTFLEEGQGSLDHIVQIDGASQMAYDRLGQPLPVAVLFDSLHGHMDDSAYDLEKAVEILNARTDVEYISKDGVDYGQPRNPIQNIPVWIAARGRYFTLPFFWQPSIEDYRRAWEYAKTHYAEEGEPGADHLRKAVFDLDLLGLRAGGAAYFDSYALTKPTEPYEDDPW